MERSIREKVGPEQPPVQSYADTDQFRLLDAETIVFDKFDEVVRRKQPFEPEKNLMLAILQEGISCFQKQLLAKGRRGKNLFHEAEMWILQRDSDGIFSFENICDTLGISPQYLRAGLIAWKNRQLMRCFGAQNVRDTPPDLHLAPATTV
jgi:hypothetical protein